MLSEKKFDKTCGENKKLAYAKKSDNFDKTETTDTLILQKKNSQRQRVSTPKECEPSSTSMNVGATIPTSNEDEIILTSFNMERKIQHD